MVVVGSGSPVVVIPGIQGRWEWMRPAIETLGQRHRVVTGSLAGEPGADRFDPALGFDSYLVQIDRWFGEAGLTRAALCGVSFGGLIAVRYAARRPERVTAVVLVSTPGARWQPDTQARQYLRAPRLLAPLFVARAPFRLLPEIVRARRSPWDAARFSVRHALRVAGAPMSPERAGTRGRLMASVDLVADARRVSAPTLILTGEPGLDRVVPVESTRSYLEFIPGAEAAVLPRTGHIGLVSRPEAFAAIVSAFVGRHDGQAAPAPPGRSL